LRRGPSHRRPANAPPVRQAVLYARVSSREQEREGFSIPAQLELLRAYAAKEGMDVLEEFVDIETAKRTGRTSFTRMVKFLKKKRSKTPAILVEKTDRLYRNLKDWVSLDGMDVDIHLVNEGIVLSEESRSSEKFVHGIKVLMAKNYVDNLSEEVRKGMNHKAADGHWPSSAPIGYLNRREGGRSLIVLDPDRALLVRSIFEMYDTGDWSVKKLAGWCAEQGYRGKRGGKISQGQIHNVLRNPLYAGKFWWAGVRYEGRDPKIIRWELFERVQARLDGFAYTRPQRRTFAFTGMITCGSCGAAITAERKKEKYTYYRCARACDGHKYVREEQVCAMYLDAVRTLRLGPELHGALVHALKQQRGDVEDDVRARMAEARGRVERFGRLIDKAYEDKLEGRITDVFFHEKRADWERRRAQAANDIERLTAVSAKNLDTGLLVLELANSAYSLLSRREPLDQRDLLEILCSNSVLTGKELTVTWRNPFDLLADRPDGTPSKQAPPGSAGGACSDWSALQDGFRTFETTRVRH